MGGQAESHLDREEVSPQRVRPGQVVHRVAVRKNSAVVVRRSALRCTGVTVHSRPAAPAGEALFMAWLSDQRPSLHHLLSYQRRYHGNASAQAPQTRVSGPCPGRGRDGTNPCATSHQQRHSRAPLPYIPPAEAFPCSPPIHPTSAHLWLQHYMTTTGKQAGYTLAPLASSPASTAAGSRTWSAVAAYRGGRGSCRSLATCYRL